MQIQVTTPQFERKGYRWHMEHDGDGDIVIAIQHNALRPFWVTGWSASLVNIEPDDDQDDVNELAAKAVEMIYAKWSESIAEGDIKRDARDLSDPRIRIVVPSIEGSGVIAAGSPYGVATSRGERARFIGRKVGRSAAAVGVASLMGIGNGIEALLVSAHDPYVRGMEALTRCAKNLAVGRE